MRSKKYKVLYMTNAMLTLKDAQSVQINSMAESFYQLLGDRFLLVSPYINNGEKQKFWKPYRCISYRNPFRYLQSCLVFFSLLLRYKPEQIFTRDIVIAAVSAVMRIPVTYEFHKESKTSFHEIIYRLFRKKIKVVAISQSLGDFLVRAYKTPPQQLCIAHDGVFTEPYDQLRTLDKQSIRREMGVPLDKVVIAHTGSLYPGRGAEIFETIAESCKDAIVLSVGGRPSDVVDWENYYKHYDNVLFVPHQNSKNLVKFQMCADLLLFPMTKNTDTYWCCSPLKLFEYMASGVPIIGANIGSVGEVLTEEVAYLFDVDNPGTIVDAISEYLSNPISGQEKGSKALLFAKTRHTWEQRAKKIIKFMYGCES